MAEPRIIPWKTISVEAVAVVVSIFLAFSIDAWWTEKRRVKLNTWRSWRCVTIS
jgi:hypothetical protein